MYFISPARPGTLPLRHHSLPPSLHTGRTTVVSGDAFAFAPARTVSRSRRHMRRRRECNSRRMQGPAAIMLSSDRDYITGPDIPEWTPCGPKLRENEMLEKAGFRAVRVPVSPVRHVPNTQFVLYAEKVLRRAGVHQPDIPVKGIEAVMEVEARPPPPRAVQQAVKKHVMMISAVSAQCSCWHAYTAQIQNVKTLPQWAQEPSAYCPAAAVRLRCTSPHDGHAAVMEERGSRTHVRNRISAPCRGFPPSGSGDVRDA